jgi:hypothetical protein
MAEFDITKNDQWPGYVGILIFFFFFLNINFSFLICFDCFVVHGYPTLLLFSPGDKDHTKKCEEFYSPQKIRRFL